ncbi:unnamed protein product [Cunninghamella blakesleeana]
MYISIYIRCTLLSNQKIYCFGGVVNSADIYNQFQPTNQFYSLDISPRPTPNQAKNNWYRIPSPPDYQLEPRAEFAFTNGFHNSTWFIFSGAGSGNNYIEPTLKNISIAFHCQNNSWTTLNFTSITRNATVSASVVQLHGASATTYVNKNIDFYILTGGLRLNNNPSINPETTSVHSVLHLLNGTLSHEVRGFDRPKTYGRNFRSQTMVIKDNHFNFGGFDFDLEISPYNNDIHYFENNQTTQNIFTRNYLMELSTSATYYYYLDDSDITPSPRYWHTINQIPYTNQLIMYGGAYNQEASKDYSYIFDSTTALWKNISFANEGPGALYGHSAIIIDNDTLYILFGADASHHLHNDVHILNLTSLKWFDHDMNKTTDHFNSNSTTTHSLSTGAIVGISIGSVVCACLIFGAIAMIIIKRKKKGYQSTGMVDLDRLNSLKNSQSNQRGTDNNSVDEHNENESHQISYYGNRQYKPTLSGDSQDDTLTKLQKGAKPYDGTPRKFKPDLGGDDYTLMISRSAKPYDSDPP